MNVRLAAVAFGAVVMTAGAAEAAITVIGTGLARACYEAAESEASARVDIVTCTRALTEEALPIGDRVATFVNRGIVHMRNRDFDEAVADYDTATKLDPQVAEAYINKGIALVHVGGQDAAAVALFDRGLALNPSRPEVAYYSRGVAHEMLGNARAAYTDYRQAAALKPDWDEPAKQLTRFSVIRKSS